MDGIPPLLHLPMSRTDIADFLGLTIETVSRTFTKLRQMGAISLQSAQDVTINDIDALHILANSDY
jgi:CRP-like cAMP-binding protein